MTVVIHHEVVSKKTPFMSLATFHKYAKWINPNLAYGRKRLKKHLKGLQAHASKQILHMDVTIFRPADRSRVYIYLIMDNFSRAIMGWKVSLQYSSELL